jgi:hypothetical protein
MDPMVDESDGPILPVSVTNTSSFLSASVTAVYYGLIYPLGWLLWLVNALLIRPIWAILNILAAPFVKIGQVILAVLGFPFRVLAKFEVWIQCLTMVISLTSSLQALFTYLLVACLFGAISGLVLFALSTFINQLLGIDSESARRKAEERKAQQATRSVADFRAEREKKKQKKRMKPLPLLPRASGGGSQLSSDAVSALSERDSFERAWSSAQGRPVQFSSQTILEEEDSSSMLE